MSDVTMLDGPALAAALDFLQVNDAERGELIESAPLTEADRAAVRAAATQLAPGIGTLAPVDAAPFDPPAGYGASTPYFSAHVCLALLPAAREFHRARGVPDDISRRSLGSLANNLNRHRRIYGCGGLDSPEWVFKVFRGIVYHLGRLVFNRDRVGAEVAQASGHDPAEPALGVHIPPIGPLRQAECLESFDRAAGFFAEYFPDEPVELAHCRSWLMDPQLARYLAADSNIVTFGRLFELIDAPEPGDDAIIRWVFEAPEPQDWRALSASSSLHRAVLRHLARGGHWQVGLGWRHLSAGGR
jgi:GNAT-like C-terminal domain/N-acyltransferase N-terminal domain